MPQDELNQLESNLSTEQPPVEEQSQVQNQPPITPPTAQPSIDPFVQQTLRELHMENKKLAQELAVRKSKEEEQKVDFNTFVADPQKVVSEAIQKQLGPIQDMFGQFARQQQYASLKQQFASHPQYGPALKQYESIIDDMMAGAEPNANNMQAAIYAAVAQSALNGQPFNPNPQPVNNQPPAGNVANAPRNIPPQARPVAPAAPVASPSAQRQLTEAERRVMGAMGFNPNDPKSVKEYFDYLEADANVTKWGEFGK